MLVPQQYLTSLIYNTHDMELAETCGQANRSADLHTLMSSTIAQQHVTYLQLPKRWYIVDMKLLAAKNWDQLGILNLRLGHLSTAAAAELSKVHCPRLTRLLISEHYDPVPGARRYMFQMWRGKWPLLYTFHCDFQKLSIAEVLALVQIQWPSLQSMLQAYRSGNGSPHAR